MKTQAYLVTLPPGMMPNQSVHLDAAKSVDYAATHRGSVAALVLKSDADRLQAALDTIKKQAREGLQPMADVIISSQWAETSLDDSTMNTYLEAKKFAEAIIAERDAQWRQLFSAPTAP